MDDERCCDCVHYMWIEDYYGDGSYVEYEYCDGDIYRDCSYYHPACEHFCSVMDKVLKGDTE